VTVHLHIRRNSETESGVPAAGYLLDGSNVLVTSRSCAGRTGAGDGRWVVYEFDDGVGQNPRPNRGIFVEPFPPTGEKHQVPRMFTDFHPLWSPDGKSIFYVPNASRPVVAVPITTNPTIAFESPFEPSRSPRPDLRQPDVRGYDFLADGRFISLSRAFAESTSSPLSGEVRVVINWFEELKRRVPTK
jgi:hypothetical protein